MSIVVVALAIALRIAWVLAVPTKPVGDFAMYVEAAAHLVEHGAFDPEYVYMPGYVFLIAPVQALGGGWLATKMVGAIVGGLGAGPVIGLARHVSGGSARIALLAGLLYALWPAGIAIASVTGTDMPAAVMVVTAAYALVRFSNSRPTLAALLFGVLTGLAAYIRAIVVPLAVLSVLVFRARRLTWRASLRQAALATLVAFLVLAPWAIRNRLRYGETFFTDSHGGLTALVGANPNTDGCYSRSLNRMFHDATGFTLLAEPHREADRASMAMAKAWIGFDPLYTVGLLFSKAERLLVHERALLYWPLFRAGVLPEPYHAFFARHQIGIEALADAFYLGMLALGLMGCGLAWARRQWLALALLPQALALTVLYTAIFAEPRYRLPIFMLLLPFSALALAWLRTTLARRARGPGLRTELLWALIPTLVVFLLAPALAYAGGRLRLHHRWAVSECRVDDRAQLCLWRGRRGPANALAPHGILGTWDGVGLALSSETGEAAGVVSAETEQVLPAGDYDVTATFELGPAGPDTTAHTGQLRMVANTVAIAPGVGLGELAARSQAGQTFAWHSTLHHPGGALRLGVEVDTPLPGARPTRLWLSNLAWTRRTM